jgi:hypothetical protein
VRGQKEITKGKRKEERGDGKWVGGMDGGRERGTE